MSELEEQILRNQIIIMEILWNQTEVEAEKSSLKREIQRSEKIIKEEPLPY